MKETEGEGDLHAALVAEINTWNVYTQVDAARRLGVMYEDLPISGDGGEILIQRIADALIERENQI